MLIYLRLSWNQNVVEEASKVDAEKSSVDPSTYDRLTELV
jgi:hypothetical protein